MAKALAESPDPRSRAVCSVPKFVQTSGATLTLATYPRSITIDSMLCLLWYDAGPDTMLDAKGSWKQQRRKKSRAGRPAREQKLLSSTYPKIPLARLQCLHLSEKL